MVDQSAAAATELCINYCFLSAPLFLFLSLSILQVLHKLPPTPPLYSCQYNRAFPRALAAATKTNAGRNQPHHHRNNRYISIDQPDVFLMQSCFQSKSICSVFTLTATQCLPINSWMTHGVAGGLQVALTLPLLTQGRRCVSATCTSFLQCCEGGLGGATLLRDCGGGGTRNCSQEHKHNRRFTGAAQGSEVRPAKTAGRRGLLCRLERSTGSFT